MPKYLYNKLAFRYSRANRANLRRGYTEANQV